jgi:hypothetical protein
LKHAKCQGLWRGKNGNILTEKLSLKPWSNIRVKVKIIFEYLKIT